MSELIFVGIDGEMTGAELNDGYSLCQIGVSFDMDKCYVSDIGIARGSPCDPKAMAVHGIPREKLEAERFASIVDKELYNWLINFGASSEKKLLIPVGFNVGAFDMPFVRRFLPNTWSLFSRRTVDLNAVCFTMGGNIQYGGSCPSWKGWKRMSKVNADQQLAAAGREIAHHNAGYDAQQAILAWHFLRSVIKGEE